MATSSAFIRASREQVFALLTDYKTYPTWAADVVDSTVLAREGDIVVAEFLSPQLMDEKYVLEFVHSRPISIAFRQVDQFGSRGVRGHWRIEEHPGRGGVAVTGELHLKRSLKQSLRDRRTAELILQRRLDSLRELFARAKREQPAAPESVSVGREILGAVRSGQEFAVWFLGDKYLVRKVGR
jgi:ribosome-associated toxin RatA of RatAB toxin-antitoxin module